MQIKTFSNTNINFQKYSPEVVKMLETRVECLYAKNLSPKEIAKMIQGGYGVPYSNSLQKVQVKNIL